MTEEKNTKSSSILKIFIFIFIIAALGVFYFWERAKTPLAPAPFAPTYTQAYRLVPEKISQSAAIRINLPPNVDKSFAQKNIKFYPELEGEWIARAEEKRLSSLRNFFLAFAAFPRENSNLLLFKPKEKLKLNRYYSVELITLDGGVVKGDFFTSEDPEISAIFPKRDSEAPETSEITVVFNRPMVPLTTLGQLEEKDVPVEISPATEGRFKWISTNNLQFIPKERLIRSSNYKIKIKPGLVSTDGLEVKGEESQFFTRKLRYFDLTAGSTVYNQPISIYFNQPVDLEKTKKEITLLNNTTKKEVPFIAEYKKKTGEGYRFKGEEESGVFGFGGIKNLLTNVISGFEIAVGLPEVFKKEDVDESIIQIYSKEDRFGREKLWDFANSYTLNINKVYPSEGDIILDVKRQTNISVTTPIADTWAESERSSFANPNFFDPQGKLWIEFYEEIDLQKSRIISPKIKELGYGQKCKEKEGVFISEDAECEKIPDKKRVYLTFQNERIGHGERLEINFDRIVNLEGLVINREPIIQYIISYPEFKILSTHPANNSIGAELTELVICSNSPITAPEKEDYENYFKSNLTYQLNSWGNPRIIYYEWEGDECQLGEFHTSIYYGLMPESDYSLELKLEDHFGQRQNLALNFTTGKMPGSRLNFYHLQRGYNVTSPQKTKLTYATENMEYVHLDICKLSALDFFYYLENKPNWDAPPTNLANCQETIKDVVVLPKRYWVKNYFKIDINDYFPENLFGHYILTFSHPDYRAEQWDGVEKKYIKVPVYERTYLTVTNLAVAEKSIQPYELAPDFLFELRNLYWVTDISDLKPIAGATVTPYQKEKNGQLIKKGSYTTDSQGIALTPALSGGITGAIVAKDKDSAIISSYKSKLGWAQSASTAEKIYLYTDKPIYRPGQEVFIRGLYRIGYDGNYEIYRDKKINLKIRNSKYDEIFSKDMEVNDFGTFNAQFVLEQNAPLGSYQICATGRYGSCASFEVLEYVPAPFEVKLKTDKEEYISKDTVNLDVEAKYYFGVPLEGGEVTYTISSQNYYFERYSDGYFGFDSGWYWEPPYRYGDKFILRGKTSLDSQGKVRISQLLDLEKLFKEKDDQKSKIIVFDVTVKNSQGQTVSGQHSFILHRGEFYLGLNSDKSFLAKDESFNLRLKSVDINGKETAVRNITLNLYKTDWIYSKRQEAGGGYSYKWEEKRELIKSHYFNTDSQGNFVQSLQISREGEYEAEASARDPRNNLISTSRHLYVYGRGEVTVRPTKDTELELEAEKINLDVGEKGRVIIKSPYPRAKALISIERGEIFSYQIKEIDGNLYSFDFEVKEEYIPNVFVSVLLVSPGAEVKFGKVEFKINTDREELNIEVKSNKTQYLPGEDVILDIFAKDYRGQPVSAELSVAVVDLSVLALKGNPKKNPLIFFYGGFPLTVSTGSNIKNILVEIEIPTKGGGGMAEEALAMKKRGIFRETAFWLAEVRTDEAGQARVRFTLPDNLTTWQVEALGLTKDTKLGVDYSEFTTKKELMVVPLKPRFVIPGDRFFIGAQIFNQSQETQDITVNFESLGLILKDETAQKRIEIRAGQSQTVYFQVESPGQLKEKEHRFTISAKGRNLIDIVENTIKCTENNTYETTATSNYTTANVWKEYVFLPDNVIKDKGGLTIKSGATLSVFLSDALNYLFQFPYGCSEQVTSKLNAIAVVKKGLNLPNIGDKFKLEKIKYGEKEYSPEEAVEIGLSELYDHQQYDGGFSFWRKRGGGSSDFYLTLHVVGTLNNLSSAGFNVNQNNIVKAVDYINAKILEGKWQYESEEEYKNRLIATAYTLSQLSDPDMLNKVRSRIVEIAKDDLFLQDRINNSSLAYLAIVLIKGFDKNLKGKIFDILDNRIDIDSRGAFLEAGKNANWRYYETPIKNTALYLKAQSAERTENPIIDKVVRWLLNSRQKDGSWGSTNNTVTVIDAFTDYLKWKKETQSNFSLELLLNEKKEGGFDFNPQTILEQFKKEVPIQELKFNENNIVQFLKTNRNELANGFYYDINLKYYLPADQIPPRDEGFSITREFYQIDDKKNENPLREAKVGEVLRGHLKITVPKTRNFVMVEDYIPAGMEIVNLELATEQKSLLLEEEYKRDRAYWQEHFDRSLYPDFKELRDDRVFLYVENLSPGVYEFDYFVRALIKGKFTHLPVQVSEMYFPENFGRTDGRYFEVK